MARTLRRLSLIALIALGLVAAPAVAEVATAEAAGATAKKAAGKAKKVACKGKKCKKKRGKFSGFGVADAALRKLPLFRPSGEVHVYSPNLREEWKGNIYNDDGSYNEEAMAALDKIWRCKRTGEERAVDP